MKIVVFGGTFDPVHSEHIKMVRGALRELCPDKMIVMPSFVPPHKDAATASAADRLEMCRLAFAFDGRIEVSGFEIERGGNSYTFETAEHFRTEYPDDELYFLLGGDSFFSFEKWVHPEIIAGAMKIAVVSRGEFTEKLMARNSEFERLHGYRAKLLSFTGDNISSTYIRACLMLGVRPEGLTDEVAGYIAKKGLYRGDRIFEYVAANLKQKRLYHTAGVVECALELNRQVGIEREKVITASVLHDVAKYTPAEKYPDLKLPSDMPQSVKHAFIGEYVAREKLGICDEDVLLAIRYHTTGRAGMTPLEKLVYVADLIERGRTYPGVDKLRKACFDDFERGFCECVRQGYKHLKQTLFGGVYYLTEEAYDYYKNCKKIN